jgi:hypothetical protein
VNKARGLSGLALGLFLLALSARAGADEPHEKRAVPNYDGRGGARETPARKLLWIPRVLLFPAYLVSEYIVRRPLAAGVTYAERARWPAAISDFLSLNEVHSVGVVPFMLIDFGFEPSAGLYAYWDDAGFKGHDLRFRGSTWGPHWLSGSLKERFEFEKLAISLKGKLTILPDLTFYGIGPDTRESDLVRYSAKTAYAHVQTSLRFGENDLLETTAGYRGASFGHSDYDQEDRGQPGYEPSLEEAVEAGTLAEPAGFRDGYRTVFAMTRLLLDSRGKARAKSGVRLDLAAEESVDLGSTPTAGWLRYGGTLGGFVDLRRGGRILGVAVTGVLVDPIVAGRIPFTQLADLGGGSTMPGLRSGRLRDRSSAVLDVRYSWPIWYALRGSLQAGIGNVFGAHFAGMRPARTRFSSAIGLETSGSGDNIFQALLGFGTETIESGAALDSIRFVVGMREGF